MTEAAARFLAREAGKKGMTAIGILVISALIYVEAYKTQHCRENDRGVTLPKALHKIAFPCRRYFHAFWME